VDQSVDQSWIRGSEVQRLKGLMRLIVDQRINRGSEDQTLIPLINADPYTIIKNGNSWKSWNLEAINWLCNPDL